MSVKLLFENRRQLMDRVGQNGGSQPVRNVLLFFGGYISRNPRGGHGLSNGIGPFGIEIPTQSVYAYAAIKKVLEEESRRHHCRTVTNTYDPCMVGDGPEQCRASCGDVRNEAARWVFRPGVFDPRGALIVYGYSAGAFNAAWFCEEVARSYAWYNFTSQRAQTAGDRTVGSEVMVDLLITIDPSIDNLPGGREATLASPRIIRRHINYYRREQNTPPARMTQESRAPDHYVDNRPRFVDSHSDMPSDTWEGAGWEIRRVLNGITDVGNSARNN